MNRPKYKRRNIRQLLIEGFSPEELEALCFDDTDLYRVCDEFSLDMPKTKIVSRILRFCERRSLFDRLLELAKEENSKAYSSYGPYLEEEWNESAEPVTQLPLRHKQTVAAPWACSTLGAVVIGCAMLLWPWIDVRDLSSYILENQWLLDILEESESKILVRLVLDTPTGWELSTNVAFSTINGLSRLSLFFPWFLVAGSAVGLVLLAVGLGSHTSVSAWWGRIEAVSAVASIVLLLVYLGDVCRIGIKMANHPRISLGVILAAFRPSIGPGFVACVAGLAFVMIGSILLVLRFNSKAGVQTAKMTPRSRTSVPIDSPKLLELLTNRFSEQELRTLCFDLKVVEYDDLLPGGRSDKARELIAHFERRGRLSELVEWGKRKRPDVPWEDALQAPGKDPSTSQTAPPERLLRNN